MNEAKQKIMVIEQEEEVRLALKDMLSPYWDVTFVDSGEEADKKTRDDEFDLIVADCILPRVAGQESALTFKSVDAVVTGDKTAFIEKVKDLAAGFETDFKAKVSESEDLLAQSRNQQDKISEMINDRLRRLEEEKIQHRREIEDMEHEKQNALDAVEEAARKVEAVQKEHEMALAEKGEAEKQLEAAREERKEAEERLAAAIEEKSEIEQRFTALTESSKANANALNSTINALKEDLERSVGAAEAAMAEKAKVEEKLERIQEQWEKFAGNQ